MNGIDDAWGPRLVGGGGGLLEQVFAGCAPLVSHYRLPL